MIKKFIGADIELTSKTLNVEIIDSSGLIAVPGFIDQHVHLIGGGGEDGYSSRTLEVMLSKAVECGSTTLIGLLGKDGTGRHMEYFFAKAKGLEDEGITTYIYTGFMKFLLLLLQAACAEILC